MNPFLPKSDKILLCQMPVDFYSSMEASSGKEGSRKGVLITKTVDSNFINGTEIPIATHHTKK